MEKEAFLNSSAAIVNFVALCGRVACYDDGGRLAVALPLMRGGLRSRPGCSGGGRPRELSRGRFFGERAAGGDQKEVKPGAWAQEFTQSSRSPGIIHAFFTPRSLFTLFSRPDPPQARYNGLALKNISSVLGKGNPQRPGAAVSRERRLSDSSFAISDL